MVLGKITRQKKKRFDQVSSFEDNHQFGSLHQYL